MSNLTGHHPQGGHQRLKRKVGQVGLDSELESELSLIRQSLLPDTNHGTPNHVRFIANESFGFPVGVFFGEGITLGPRVVPDAKRENVPMIRV